MTKTLLFSFGFDESYPISKFFPFNLYTSPITNEDLYHDISKKRKSGLNKKEFENRSFYSKIQDVKSGENHILIQENNEIAAIGYCGCGQLGMSSLTKRHGISDLRNVSKIWCGMNFSFAQTQDKKLYGCGWNAQCQITPHISEKEIQMWREIPINILFYEVKGPLIDIISASMHTFFIFENNISSMGMDIYLTGNNDSGACAVPFHKQGSISNVKCDVLKRFKIKKLCTSDIQTLFLTECGRCFAAGYCHFESKNNYASLLCTSCSICELIFPSKEKILDVVTSSSNSLFCMENNSIYRMSKDGTLTKINLPIANPVLHLVSGYFSSAVVDTNRNIYLIGNLNSKIGELHNSRKFRIVQLENYIPKDIYLSKWDIEKVVLTNSYLMVLLRKSENIEFKLELLSSQKKGELVDLYISCCI